MKRDALRDAVSALRKAADVAPARPAETRARVMRTLRTRRRGRLAAVRTFVLLAAVLVGSGAWAATRLGLPPAWDAIAAALGLGAREPGQPPTAPEDARSGASAPVGAATRAPTSEAADAPLIEPGRGVDEHDADISSDAPGTPSETPGTPSSDAPPVIAASPVTSPSATYHPPGMRQPDRQAASSTPPAATAPAPAPIDAEAHALYQAAHRAHFVDRNPSAALAAWNAYLAAAPRGRFSVEAHYNRALCFVRLGRADAARKALDPFARGAFGGYRQTEARALLAAMDGTLP